MEKYVNGNFICNIGEVHSLYSADASISTKNGNARTVCNFWELDVELCRLYKTDDLIASSETFDTMRKLFCTGLDEGISTRCLSLGNMTVTIEKILDKGTSCNRLILESPWFDAGKMLKADIRAESEEGITLAFACLKDEFAKEKKRLWKEIRDAFCFSERISLEKGFPFYNPFTDSYLDKSVRHGFLKRLINCIYHCFDDESLHRLALNRSLIEAIMK